MYILEPQINEMNFNNEKVKWISLLLSLGIPYLFLLKPLKSIHQRITCFLESNGVSKEWFDLVVENAVPMNLALFYLYGVYYSFSNRILGIKYVPILRALFHYDYRAGLGKNA